MVDIRFPQHFVQPPRECAWIKPLSVLLREKVIILFHIITEFRAAFCLPFFVLFQRFKQDFGNCKSPFGHFRFRFFFYHSKSRYGRYRTAYCNLSLVKINIFPFKSRHFAAAKACKKKQKHCRFIANIGVVQNEFVKAFGILVGHTFDFMRRALWEIDIIRRRIVIRNQTVFLCEG